MMTKLSRAEEETSNSRLGRKLQRLQLHRIAAEDHVDGLSGLHAPRAFSLLKTGASAPGTPAVGSQRSIAPRKARFGFRC